MLVRDLHGQIALATESIRLSDVDRFSVQEITECLKPVNGTTTAIQLKILAAGEFFSEWHKSVNYASSLAVAMLHTMECRKLTLLSNAAFSTAIYVDTR